MKAGRKTSRSVGDVRNITSSRNASSSILTIRGSPPRHKKSPQIPVEDLGEWIALPVVARHAAPPPMAGVARRRRAGLAPQQMRQDAWSGAYQQHPQKRLRRDVFRDLAARVMAVEGDIDQHHATPSSGRPL